MIEVLLPNGDRAEPCDCTPAAVRLTARTLLDEAADHGGSRVLLRGGTSVYREARLDAALTLEAQRS